MYAGVYYISICRTVCKKTVVVGGANFDFRDDVFSRFQCCERANCLVQEMIRIQCGDDRLFFFSFYFDLE